MGITQAKAVADVIAERMESQGLSVKALSEQAFIPRATLGRRLGGESSAFTIDELDRIARVLGQSASDLMAAADAVRAA